MLLLSIVALLRLLLRRVLPRCWQLSHRLQQKHHRQQQPCLGVQLDWKRGAIAMQAQPNPKGNPVIPSAVAALRPGGMLGCWVPTTPQLDSLGAAIREEPLLVETRTSEILQRYWHVAANSVRPDHRMIGHTGFLMTAWRLADMDDSDHAGEPPADVDAHPPVVEDAAAEGTVEPSSALPVDPDHDNNPERDSN